MKKLLLPVFCALLTTFAAPAQPAGAAFQRIEDVIYGRKFGTALTLDVFQSVPSNGHGVVLVVSGGWYSSRDAINPAFCQPFLNRGYTVFAVVHGSQPKFNITEILPDIHRALRFIRHHAARYGVRPDQLGITGGSAGGHLSLMMAGTGRPGDPNARDGIDRESSAVQAVACFFPPTDFLNYGAPGEDAVGVGVLKDFKSGFGPGAETPEGRQRLGREISPVNFIHSNQAPVLILHGDADQLVPLYQAERYVARAKELGAKAKLIVREGKAHGWPEMVRDMEIFADWFDEHLRGVKPPAR